MKDYVAEVQGLLGELAEACVGEGFIRANDRDPSVAEVQRAIDKHARILAIVGELVRERDRAYRDIVSREHFDAPRCDHACEQCVPEGQSVRAGFVCVYHKAIAALAARKAKDTANG